MKKVGIYIRVSTQEQAEEGYSIQAQKERLINYCKAKDWNIVDIYVDGGYSGSNLDRPGIQKLIEDVETGKMDIVLVYKLDRLSRSQKDTLYLIEDVFLKNEVDFVSMNESFDTATPFGRAMIGILSVFAQLERETIKERSLMGRKERAKEGLFHGGKFAPIGYDYIDGKLIVNEYEAMQVREIFDLYVFSGYGDERIRRTLKKKGYKHKAGNWNNPASVASVLTNPIYIGKIKYDGMIFDGLHEPIISEEIFERAQAIREKRKNSFRRVYKSNSLLAGLIFCGNCGARYFVKSVSKYKYYSCYSRSKPSRHMVKDPNCKNKHWNIAELDKKVEAEILKLAFDKKELKRILSRKQKKTSGDLSQNREVIERKIRGIDKQIERLMDLYQLESIPIEEISRRIDRLYEEKKTLQEQLPDSQGQEEEKNFDLEWIDSVLGNVKLIWKHAEIEEKRNILRSLINRIIINGDNIKIEWSFA